MANDAWATPPALVRRISNTLGLEFTLDVCASDDNHKTMSAGDDGDEPCT